MNLIIICHRCPRRSDPPYTGDITCKESGRSCHVHARDRSCPLGKMPTTGDYVPLPDPNQPCTHRGPEARQVECSSCVGKVMIKLFACAIYGECSLGDKPPDVRHCQGCPEKNTLVAQT